MQSQVVLRTRRLGAVLMVCLLGACDSDSPTAPTQTPPPPVNVPFSTEDLTVGAGPPAMVGQSLSVAYTGWLYDPTATDNKGSVFDQGDLDFVLGDPGFLDGWNMGIEGMREGGRRRIVIPPDLGYGQVGVPGRIPPDSTLIFEVDLVSVQ